MEWLVLGKTYDTDDDGNLTTEICVLKRFETKEDAEKFVSETKSGYMLDEDGEEVYIDNIEIVNDEPEYTKKRREAKMIDCEDEEMTVGKLKELLSKCDDSSPVYIDDGCTLSISYAYESVNRDVYIVVG